MGSQLLLLADSRVEGVVFADFGLLSKVQLGTGRVFGGLDCRQLRILSFGRLFQRLFRYRCFVYRLLQVCFLLELPIRRQVCRGLMGRRH